MTEYAGTAVFMRSASRLVPLTMPTTYPSVFTNGPPLLPGAPFSTVLNQALARPIKLSSIAHNDAFGYDGVGD